MNPGNRNDAVPHGKGFPNVPPYTGSIEYRRTSGENFSIALLQGLVFDQGDAWQYTIDSLSRFFEHALTRPDIGFAAAVRLASSVHAGQRSDAAGSTGTDRHLQ